MSVPKTAYFDVSADGKPLGRVNFLLFPNTPRTSGNFGTLCEGFQPRYPLSNRGKTQMFKSIGYKNTYMHRIIPGFMVQGGDVTDACVDPQSNRPYPGSQPGTGGASVYGEKFRDENFLNKHRVGVLSMANRYVLSVHMCLFFSSLFFGFLMKDIAYLQHCTILNFEHQNNVNQCNKRTKTYLL